MQNFGVYSVFWFVSDFYSPDWYSPKKFLKSNCFCQKHLQNFYRRTPGSEKLVLEKSWFQKVIWLWTTPLHILKRNQMWSYYANCSLEIKQIQKGCQVESILTKSPCIIIVKTKAFLINKSIKVLFCHHFIAYNIFLKQLWHFLNRWYKWYKFGGFS